MREGSLHSFVVWLIDGCDLLWVGIGFGIVTGFFINTWQWWVFCIIFGVLRMFRDVYWEELQEIRKRR